MMTRNLRGYTVKAMKDGNIRGKIDDDQTQSVFTCTRSTQLQATHSPSPPMG